jgi:hypothetical protein
VSREGTAPPGGSTVWDDWVRRYTKRHSLCGLPVLLVRLDHADPAAVARAPWPRDWITLDPCQFPGEGSIAVDENGLATVHPVGTRRAGVDYETHKCPEKVLACKHCGEEIRVLRQPPRSKVHLAVVDAAPNPYGWFVVDADGHAVRDPDRAMPGPRYRWHEKHGGSPRKARP